MHLSAFKAASLLLINMMMTIVTGAPSFPWNPSWPQPSNNQPQSQPQPQPNFPNPPPTHTRPLFCDEPGCYKVYNVPETNT